VTETIGIGIVGAGYMGKLHSVAMQAVASVFQTKLKPVCEMICTTTPEGAVKASQALGFKRATADWRELVNDPKVQPKLLLPPVNLCCVKNQWAHRWQKVAAWLNLQLLQMY